MCPWYFILTWSICTRHIITTLKSAHFIPIIAITYVDSLNFSGRSTKIECEQLNTMLIWGLSALNATNFTLIFDYDRCFGSLTVRPTIVDHTFYILLTKKESPVALCSTRSVIVVMHMYTITGLGLLLLHFSWAQYNSPTPSSSSSWTDGGVLSLQSLWRNWFANSTERFANRTY